MGKIKFDINNLEEIIKRGYSMDQIVLLTWIQEKADLSIPSRHTKVQALYQSLIRKGLINDDGNIAKLGTELLEYMETKDPEKLVKKRAPAEKKVVESSYFNDWWKTWPSNDTFDYKGVHFDGDRSFKTNPDGCRVLFAQILQEGEYTAQELIDALKLEVLRKKESSIREKTNKLKYLRNSHTYLVQRTYEGVIDDVKKGVIITEGTVSRVQRGGTDI